MIAHEGANPHRSAGTVTIGPDPADAVAVVVAVHGRNQSPDYLREHLVEPVLARLDADAATAISWILPAAAENTWYPSGFLAPLDENQPWLDHALDVMARIDADLADRDPGSVLWCGFSQGACLATEYLARHPAPGGRRRGGLASLTGGMIGPSDDPLVVDGDFGGLPVYFGVGDPDDWVPVWRVHDSAEAYAAAGADVTTDVFPGRPHEISATEVDAVVDLLRPLLST